MLIPRPLLPAAGRAVGAVLRRTTPVLAQLVVTRRCNLSCGYCNEYDQVSAPVPADELVARIDRIADLGTVVVTLTGGEPLLHPELDLVIAHAVRRGLVCTSITNGYPLTRTWIERLGRARLTLLQVSIDNLDPNPHSEKSWSRLRPKLELLRDHAGFAVNVNAVLGSCTVEETRQVVAGVRELGFYMTVGLMHDAAGQLDPGLAGDRLGALYDELRTGSRKSLFHRGGEGWEQRMIATGSAPFRCRAGARYLYVDEAGSVSYCSQRRGEPGIPLERYGRADLERSFAAAKGCEERCTIACVRRASAFDERRAQAPPPAAVTA